MQFGANSPKFAKISGMSKSEFSGHENEKKLIMIMSFTYRPACTLVGQPCQPRNPMCSLTHAQPAEPASGSSAPNAKAGIGRRDVAEKLDRVLVFIK